MTPAKSQPGRAPAADCDSARLTSPRLSEIAVTRTVTSPVSAGGISTGCSVSFSLRDGSTTTARTLHDLSAWLPSARRACAACQRPLNFGFAALLAPGLVRFLLVLGHLQHGEAVEIAQHRVRQRHVDAAVQQLLGQPRRQRRQRGDVLRHLHRARHQRVMRHQPLREADAIRLLRLQRKAERGAHRQALADPARQPRRTALRGDDAETALRQPPLRALGGDDHVAAIGDDAADADGVAVHRGDDRLGEVGQHRQRMRAAAVRQVLDERGDRVHRVGARVLQVGAGTERAAPVVAGQDDAADVGIGLQFRQALAQAGLEFLAPGVAGLGPAQRQDGDGTVAFAEQRHRGFLLRRRPIGRAVRA